MNLRGKEKRIKFVEEYDLKPISHQKLLKGQVKESVGGSELTDRYYCFLYNKKGQTYQDTFICGYYIAEDLLRLTEQDKLSLFNPLQADVRNINRNNQIEENNGQRGTRQWNDVAHQLSNAINLFIAYWDKPINGVLAKIHFEINKYYYNVPFDGKIKAVNTSLEKLLPNMTLKDVQQELSKENDIRDYEFNLLNEVLEAKGITSKFG